MNPVGVCTCTHTLSRIYYIMCGCGCVGGGGLRRRVGICMCGAYMHACICLCVSMRACTSHSIIHQYIYYAELSSVNFPEDRLFGSRHNSQCRTSGSRCRGSGGLGCHRAASGRVLGGNPCHSHCWVGYIQTLEEDSLYTPAVSSRSLPPRISAASCCSGICR